MITFPTLIPPQKKGKKKERNFDDMNNFSLALIYGHFFVSDIRAKQGHKVL